VAPFSVTLPGASDSARAARRALREWMQVEGVADLDDDGSVVVSELITNAVVHGGEPIRLALTCGDGVVRLEVFDSNATLARRGDVHTAGTGGRGLQIVESLSSDWGSHAVEGGKVTWACLDMVAPRREEGSTISLR
jgi:anti-sigma regulatory factor (Ser/Thr protein kinase)